MTTTILVGQVIAAAAADDDNDCHDNNVIAMIMPMVGLFYVAVPLGVPSSDSNPIPLPHWHCVSFIDFCTATPHDTCALDGDYISL